MERNLKRVAIYVCLFGSVVQHRLTHCKSIILPQKFYKWRRKYQLLSPSGWEGCGSDDGQKQMSWAAAVAGWVQGWGEEQARWQLGFWLECLVDGASLRRNGLRVCGERAFRAKGQWGISGAVKIPGRHHSWVMRNAPRGGRTSQDSGHGSWRGSRFQVGQREDEIKTGTWPWGWQLAAGGCRESRFHAVGWCPGVQWIEGWLGYMVYYYLPILYTKVCILSIPMSQFISPLYFPLC